MSVSPPRALFLRDGDLAIAPLEEKRRPVHLVNIRVKTVGLNRADLLQRAGKYPAPKDVPQDILGLEFAGEVLRAPKDAGFSSGDRVMGLVGGGAMSERLHVHPDELIRIPSSIDFDQAAAIPEAFMTAFDALEQTGAAAGETLLVHAAASGVGLATVQLAKRLGMYVIGTTRSEHKREAIVRAGADECVVTKDATFAKELSERPDVIIDLVGGGYAEENLRAIAKRGRWIVVGLVAGASAKLFLPVVLSKRVTLMGTVLRSRSLDEKIGLTKRFSKRTFAAFASGDLGPVVDRVVPMTEAKRAFAAMANNENTGKIVLRW